VANTAAGAAPASTAAALPAPPTGCTQTDLIPAAAVTSSATVGNPRAVQDRQLAVEGTLWDAPAALRFRTQATRLMVDLRAPQSLRYLVLQGDDNDNYHVEGSLDGVSYRPLFTFGPSSDKGQGLRTRSAVLPKPEEARYLRIHGSGGDGFYSISELRAYCAKPTAWPPVLKEAPRVYGWRAIDNDMMVVIKGWAALFATLVLIAWWASRRFAKLRRTCDALLALCGLFAFLSWWNIGHYHFDHYVHIWEHYHYYMGAKYGPELRYSRLYECTAAADLADGLRTQVKKRQMRDLAFANKLGTTEHIVTDPTLCTRHFTPERWNEFRKDIRFFRGRFSTTRWDESQTDHGYNGTPVWAIAGRLITDTGELNWQKIERIAVVDSALLVVMWLVALWAFGWRASCVALLWWGFNFPARFYWNGGSFLRYDWLVLLVIGICLLKKRFHFGAGVALTYATLLRVFPGFVVAALVLKALARIVRHRRLLISRAHLLFAAGCITAGAVLIPASSWATGGLDAWPQFVKNSEKHLKTALTNNMGLKTALGYDPATRASRMRDPNAADPFDEWKNAREYFYGTRQPILVALLLLFCVMLARAGDREPDWVAACLGAGMIALASELTCYYYGFLLTYGLLWERHKIPGILATLLAALTCWFYFLMGWNDDHFGAMSLATSITVVLVTAWVGFRPEPVKAPEAAVDRTDPPSQPAGGVTAEHF
jgi:hypothetical protein